jgi:hypothetical protein
MPKSDLGPTTSKTKQATGSLIATKKRARDRIVLRAASTPATHRKVVGAQSLGHQAREAKRTAQRQGRRGSKFAVILHRMWIEGTEFKWSAKDAANQPA